MNITYDILYNEDGDALVGIFENDEEHSCHRVRADIAEQWARQQVAYIIKRRAEEAAWLSRDDSHRLDY